MSCIKRLQKKFLRQLLKILKNPKNYITKKSRLQEKIRLDQMIKYLQLKVVNMQTVLVIQFLNLYQPVHLLQLVHLNQIHPKQMFCQKSMRTKVKVIIVLTKLKFQCRNRFNKEFENRSSMKILKYSDDQKKVMIMMNHKIRIQTE